MAHVPVEESDAELIRLTAARDHDAFSALVSRHGAAVFRFARLIAANQSAAEDALQETFLAAWRASGSFQEDTRVRNWLLSIAHLRGCDWCERFGGSFQTIVESLRRELQIPQALENDVAVRLREALKKSV